MIITVNCKICGVVVRAGEYHNHEYQNYDVSLGRKDDQEKLRFDLLAVKPLEELVRVLMHGAKKYGDFNYRQVPEARRRYYAAALRHLTAWWGGEKLDTESKLSHLSHACACLFFLSELDQ